MADTSGKLAPRTVLTDVFAGTIVSILTIAYCLSYAALIFTGPLNNLIAYGVAVTLLSAAIGGAAVAMRSSLPFAIAGPDSAISVVLAAMVATLARRLAAGGETALLEPTLIVLALATAFTGLALFMLGMARAGRAMRFVPYPVIGGFLGATGCLMIVGAIQIVTDTPPRPENLVTIATPAVLAKVAAAVILAIVLHVVMRLAKSAFALPGVLLAAVAATHLGLVASGTSLAQAQAAGWLFHPQAAAPLTSVWHVAAVTTFPWHMLPSLAGDIIAVIFVTAITLLLNTTGIELATATEADIDRDLKVLGAANLLSAAFGGIVSCTSVSRSTLARVTGGQGRVTGLTVAAICAGLVAVGPGFIGAVPKFALGGVLLFLGAGLILQWLVRASRQLLPLEYASLIAIAALIVYFGFVAGILIGVVIGCATFAFNASRVSAIRFGFDGSELSSSLDRNPDELAIIAEHGPDIQGLVLQSYLFFGSANRLYQHVKKLLARRATCRFLVFDFRHVTGIDSAAINSFVQIARAAREREARIVFVSLSPELERAFRGAPFGGADIAVARDLDRALETCEQAIIAVHRAANAGTRPLLEWFADALGSAHLARLLLDHCRRLDLPAGGIIARQGDAAAAMHFILDGRIGVMVAVEDGRTVRVRSLGPQTTVGEMGLITGRPRSATITAELPSVLYELDSAAFERINQNHPALGRALLGYIIAVMTERLGFANRLIGVLQR